MMITNDGNIKIQNWNNDSVNEVGAIIVFAQYSDLSGVTGVK